MDTVTNTGSSDAKQPPEAYISPLIVDVTQAGKEVTALVAAYHAKGPAGIAALLPALAPELEKDFDDIKAVLPTIKAGYKTTEFWIVVGVCVGVGIMGVMGKVSPVDSASLITALSGVYAMVRGLLKKPTT